VPSRLIDTDRGGRCALLDIVLAVPVDSTAASRFVRDLRTELAPRALAGTRVDARTGGLTAQYADLAAETTGKLPLVVAIVLAVSFCYLLLVFRSLLLPAKAVVLNLVATAAALGLTVFVFQFGRGARVLDFHSVGTLQAYLPVALFALLFGLSMDYEVFLVRRIQEEWLRSGDNAEAVAVAVARTARQITAAAAIMVAVFASFLAAHVLELKQFGFGLSIAVLLDATAIRLLLVPAIMGIASRGNWWLPGVLARRLPSLRLE
jgi:RND superfamily putative drug exporter